MRVVPFLLLVAAAGIIAGIVVVGMGRGGELMSFHRDLPAAHFRLTTGLFGYREQVTNDVLHAVANMLAIRDAEIASLRDEVWRLSASMSTSPVSVEPGSAADPGGSPGLPPSPR